MNIVILTGRLTADATVRTASDPSKNNAKFNVAVTDPWNSEKTDYFTISCFGKKADYVMNGLQKGRFLKGCEVEISGPIHLVSYKTQQGEDRYYMNVIAETLYCKVHKDFKGNANPQNGQGATNNIPQGQNNSVPRYGQQSNAASPAQQFNSQNTSGSNGSNQQYSGNSGYRNQNGGNSGAYSNPPQFNQSPSGNQGTGRYSGNQTYGQPSGAVPAQQYSRPSVPDNHGSGQNNGNSGYQYGGGKPEYNRPNNGTPANQGGRPQQYTPGNGSQTAGASSQYSGAYENLPDSLPPAPDFRRESEGGFRPATYRYE